MANLLEKVSTLVSANLHALVDQALQSNSLAVIDQYLRQVEDQLENLEDAAATVGGEVRSIRRKLEEHQRKADRRGNPFRRRNGRVFGAFAVRGVHRISRAAAAPTAEGKPRTTVADAISSSDAPAVRPKVQRM